MSLTLYHRNIDSDLTGGGARDNTLALATGVDASISVTLAASASVMHSTISENGLNFTGATGDYQIYFRIVDGNVNAYVRATLHRVNSSGAIQASSSESTEQKANNDFSTTFQNLNLGTFAEGDRLRVDFTFRNNASNKSITFGYGVNTVNDYIATPLTEAESNDKDASASATINVLSQGAAVKSIQVGAEGSINIAAEGAVIGETSPVVENLTLQPSVDGVLASWQSTQLIHTLKRRIYASELTAIPSTNTQTGLGDTFGTSRWGLNRISQRDLPMDGEYNWEFNGAGVRVYVFDAGVRVTHNEFEGRIAEGIDVCSTDEINDPTQDTATTGHGTKVAGIVLGATCGVAKGATLIPVRLRSDSGIIPELADFIAALDWVKNNHPVGARGVIIAPMPNPEDGTEDGTALQAKVVEVVQTGIVFVHSSGNTEASQSRSLNRLSETITVGSINQDDSSNQHSATGEYTDIYAATSVLTSSKDNDVDIIDSAQGTSFAAPHVAGWVAIYLQANPNATPAQVKAFMIEHSTKDKITGLPVDSHNRILFAPLHRDTVEIIDIQDTQYLDSPLLANTYQYQVKATSPEESEYTDFEAIVLPEQSDVPVKDGLVFNLDASKPDSIVKDGSGKITTWNDLSGEENHVSNLVTSEQPTYLENSDDFEGRPAIYFGATQILKAVGKTPLNNKAGGTIFHVAVRQARSSSEVTGYVASFTNTDSQRALTTGYYDYQVDPSYYFATVRTDAGNGDILDGLDGYGQRYINGSKDLRTVYWGSSIGELVMRVNGLASTSVARTGTHITQAGSIYIGRFSPTSQNDFIGTIAEIVAFDRVLTAQEILEVETYLHDKWIAVEDSGVPYTPITAVSNIYPIDVIYSDGYFTVPPEITEFSFDDDGRTWLFKYVEGTWVLYEHIEYPVEDAKDAGASATVTILAEGVKAKSAQAGSSSTILIAAQGEESKHIQVGASASIEIAAQGEGIKDVGFGASADISILSDGQAVKSVIQGSGAEIIVLSEGSESKDALVSGDAVTNITAEGAATTEEPAIERGGESVISITAGGVGSKDIVGYGEARNSILSEGGGVKSVDQGSDAGIVVLPEGYAIKEVLLSGGGQIGVSAEGSGIKNITDDGEAVINVAGEASGVKQGLLSKESEIGIASEGSKTKSVSIGAEVAIIVISEGSATAEEPPVEKGTESTINISAESDTTKSVSRDSEASIGISAEANKVKSVLVGASATINILSESAATKNADKEGEAVVNILSETDKVKGVSVGVSTAINILSEGAEIKGVDRGSEAAVNILSEANKIKSVLIGTESAISISAEGEATAEEPPREVGAEATANISAEASGIKITGVGSEALNEIIAEALGEKSVNRGSQALINIFSEGAKVKGMSMGSDSTIAISAEGLATAEEVARIIKAAHKYFLIAAAQQQL